MIITGGALNVELEAETLARDHSTLSSKKQNITSINNRSTSRSNSHQIAGRCSSQESQQTQQRSKKSYQFTTYSPKLSCGETSRYGVGVYIISTRK